MTRQDTDCTGVRPRRALLSVTDKRGLPELARALVEHDVELIASGGTAAVLRDAGLAVTAVEEITAWPEMLGGRVKTLHPAIHAGLLADRDDPAHRADLEAHQLRPLDLVVVNFYAFDAAATTGTLPIEAIDIGGPTLVRAAAKNHAHVLVLTAPDDYPEFLEALAARRLDLPLRREMARRAFARVAEYDRQIAAAFDRAVLAEALPETGSDRLPIPGRGATRPLGNLRYGENPHQRASAWAMTPAWGLGAMRQHGGIELSYNNFVDADAALDLAYDLGSRPACVIVKHNNPCGVALAPTPAAAFEAALACDPVSAFGGVVAFNVPVDAEAAEALAGRFLEIVCAPAIQPVARERLARKKRLRLLEVPRPTWQPDDRRAVERMLHGVVLVQERDHGFPELHEARVVTRVQPDAQALEDAHFLWAVCKHVRSNAIVVGREQRTLGIGAGQMSRVDSCELAVRKAADAGLDLRDSVAASDAFFPFPDGVEKLAAAGVTLVVQPGGSKKDDAVIEAADRLGIAMVFTGRRHFRH